VALRTTLETSDVGPRMSGKSGVGAVRFTLDKRCLVIIELSATEMALLFVQQVRDSKRKHKVDVCGVDVDVCGADVDVCGTD